MADNKFKDIKDNYDKNHFVNVCKAVRKVSEDNRVILSFQEHKEFNKRMNPALKHLIDMEIGLRSD